MGEIRVAPPGRRDIPHFLARWADHYAESALPAMREPAVQVKSDTTVPAGRSDLLLRTLPVHSQVQIGRQAWGASEQLEGTAAEAEAAEPAAGTAMDAFGL